MTRGSDDASVAGARFCRNCRSELALEEVGWECECGVVVCRDPGCFEEYFKTVAGGEGTRCRTCGLVT